jgi:hypothetical protein
VSAARATAGRWAWVGPIVAALALLIAVDSSLPSDRVRAEQRDVAVPATAPQVGTFTGDYVDGLPVYRLPPLIVVADPAEWALSRVSAAERRRRS